MLNRRSFLARLATAAAGVASIGLIDPEQLLWTPGAKTIIDLGATRQVLPATDSEVVKLASQFDQRLAELSADDVRGLREMEKFVDGPRHMKLEIFDPERQQLRAFKFSGDQLVGRYTPADLALLDTPFTRTGKGRA
jgi:hypothetical protein